MEDIDDILSKIDDNYSGSTSQEGTPDEIDLLIGEHEKKKKEFDKKLENQEEGVHSVKIEGGEKTDITGTAEDEDNRDASPAETFPEPTVTPDVIEDIFIPPFTIKGTKSWNNKEPYLIKVDYEALKKEYAEISKSFYFMHEPVSPEVLKDALKRAIIQYMRKPSDTINDRYEEFVFRTIFTIVEDIAEIFTLDDENKMLMLYHSGPLSVYNIICKTFATQSYGSCYKYMTHSKASRFLPKEYIKEKTLVWYEENINSKDIEFDSLQGYDAIKNMVTRKYQSSLAIFNNRYSELNKKIAPKRSISREKLLNLKGDQWFGIASLELFRRFVGKSIFI